MTAILLVFLAGCHAVSHTADTATSPTLEDRLIVYDSPPVAIVEWTDSSLVVNLEGPDISYWFGISEELADPEAAAWTGEDCYLGWPNDHSGRVIRYCHPLINGANAFDTNAYTEGLDPSQETWFGLDDFRDPDVTLSYAVWTQNHALCWSWGGSYYNDVCLRRRIEEATR